MPHLLPVQTNLEVELRGIMVRFQKDCFGRGPLNCKVEVIRDKLIFYSFGILSTGEKAAIEKRTHSDILDLLQRYRRHIIDANVELLKEQIEELMSKSILGYFQDTKPELDECLLVIRLQEV